MKRRGRQKRISVLARAVLLLAIPVLFLSQSGIVIWQSFRLITYHYFRHHTEEQDVQLVLSREVAGELIWVKKREIRYRGRMFDIRSMRETDTGLVITGHFDRKDDVLFNWLKKLIDLPEGSDRGTHKMAFWFFDALAAGSPGLAAPVDHTGTTAFIVRDLHIPDPYPADCPSPPPEQRSI